MHDGFRFESQLGKPQSDDASGGVPLPEEVAARIRATSGALPPGTGQASPFRPFAGDRDSDGDSAEDGAVERVSLRQAPAGAPHEPDAPMVSSGPDETPAPGNAARIDVAAEPGAPERGSPDMSDAGDEAPEPGAVLEDLPAPDRSTAGAPSPVEPGPISEQDDAPPAASADPGAEAPPAEPAGDPPLALTADEMVSADSGSEAEADAAAVTEAPDQDDARIEHEGAASDPPGAPVAAPSEPETAAPAAGPDPAPNEAHDPVSMIRNLIESHAAAHSRTEAEDAVPEAADAAEPTEATEAPAPAPARSAASDEKRQDRWAKLREALIETDLDGAEEDVDGLQEAAPAPPTPIERIRAKQTPAPLGPEEAPAAREIAERPDPDPVAAPLDESAFGPSGTHEPDAAAHAAPGPATRPEPQSDPQADAGMDAAPDSPRTWDSPEDHEMSSRGKMLWRVGIYGAILAVPTLLVLTSPFSPKATVQHYVAAIGCTAAGYAGVAPAEAGAPGYHARLDVNGNGVACEPEVQRSLAGNGSVRFIKAGDY